MEIKEVKFKQLIEGCETIGDLQKRIGNTQILSKGEFFHFLVLPKKEQGVSERAPCDINNKTFAEDLVDGLD